MESGSPEPNAPSPLPSSKGGEKGGKGAFYVTMVGKLISYRDENAIAEICCIMAISRNLWEVKGAGIDDA